MTATDPDALRVLLTRAQHGVLSTTEATALREHVEQLHARTAELEAEAQQLRARIETLEHVAASNKRHVQVILPELEAADAARRALRQRAERAEAALDRVRAVVNDLCGEPHSGHDHVCPDDVRRYVLDAIAGPARSGPQS